ncbi:MAG TPA: hypothetical protein VF115_10050, partial [Acidimicrobiia bacterium]
AIDLGRRLGYQETIEIHLEYDIPGDPPRSRTTFRINPAYINFAVAGWGDPGLATVNVATPASFDLELTGSDWDETRTVDGTTVHTVSSIDDPGEFLIEVRGYDEAALATEMLSVRNAEIVVGAWPGDIEWSDQVATSVITGLPTLMELVGLPWTVEDALFVNESAEVFLAGYGGWYLRDQSLIEVSEWADPHLVLHELSHVWFNQDLFTGRWISEGLAEVFSLRAVADAGLADENGSDTESPPVDDGEVGFLNSWVIPDPEELEPDQIRAYEEYGYATSRWVIQDTIDEIGFENMAVVLAAAADDLIAYRGAPEPERVDPRDDWRRLLDLVEELGGATGASELFAKYVTDEDLTSRSQTRAEYHELIKEGQGWLAPFYVREPLSAWDFAETTARIAEARAILDDRFEAESNLAVIGVAPGITLEETYESASDSLEETRSLAEQMVDVSGDVLEAREVLSEERSLMTEIGLLGVNPDEEYQEAVDELEEEDLDRAAIEARELVTLLEGAEDRGRLRAGLAAGALVLMIGGTVVVMSRRRRRERETLAS